MKTRFLSRFTPSPMPHDGPEAVRLLADFLRLWYATSDLPPGPGMGPEPLQSLDKEVEMAQEQSPVVHFTRARLLLAAGRCRDGAAVLDEALGRCTPRDEHDTGSTIGLIRDLIPYVNDPETLRLRIKVLVLLYRKHNALAPLAHGVMECMPDIISESIGDTAVHVWLDSWKAAAGELPEFRLPLRFLDLADRIVMAPLPEQKLQPPRSAEELGARTVATERRLEEQKNQFFEEIARTRARLEADYERKVQLATHDVVLPFLDVLDNLERAVAVASQNSGGWESLRKGIEMTVDLFHSRLQALGVEAIAVLNQPYDPGCGEAVGVIEVDDPSRNGMVVELLLTGYRMGDQLLRPAQVRVGRARNGETQTNAGRQ